jgi:hypothetical protein
VVISSRVRPLVSGRAPEEQQPGDPQGPVDPEQAGRAAGSRRPSTPVTPGGASTS